MRLPERFLEEVKGRFRLSEVIGRSVPLKRSGREFTALSPFVKEKTPSFFVNDEKAFFHDFSSGKHGDVFDWLVETKGLTFREAVEQLAAEAGLELPTGDAATEQAEHRRKHLERLLQAAQAVFRQQLPRAPDALAYLDRRGLGAADIERFGIGYASDRAALHDRIDGEPKDLLAAGLCVAADNGRIFDRYRDRITFPIHDPAGRLISFGARALDPKAKAKYLNGPDTELFDKGKQLYGLDMARKLLAAGPGPLVVVEGYMDVIACLRAGVAACAPMGTSLTPPQMELMWRFHPEPTLCFDADAAGRRAAARAMDHALPKLDAGKSLRFLHVTGGKDADDVLREQGADALRAQISRGIPFVEAILHREIAAAPLDTPEQRTALRERLRKIVNLIPDRTLGREYAEAFRVKLEALRQAPRQRPASTAAMESAKALREAAPPSRVALAYWLVKDPARALEDLERIEAAGFGHAELDALTHEVVAWLTSHEPDPEALAQHLSARGLGGFVAGLSDDTGEAADRGAWRRLYRALAEYLDLDRAAAEAKTQIKTAADMARFNTLKSQRDAARKAL